jgi:hypothetical protein
MAPKRFQVSIRDMMIAMFWEGLTISAWSWAFRLAHDPAVGILSLRHRTFEMNALAALGWSTMFPAVYSLIGRVRMGAAIGAGMWIILVIAIWFGLS